MATEISTELEKYLLRCVGIARLQQLPGRLVRRVQCPPVVRGVPHHPRVSLTPIARPAKGPSIGPTMS